jgi:hypothetical protein
LRKMTPRHYGLGTPQVSIASLRWFIGGISRVHGERAII